MEERKNIMKSAKLTKKEQSIERGLIRGAYKPLNKSEFTNIAESIQRRKKDAVLNLRVNSEDLDNLKQKAKQLGIPYQTFISEFLHRLAA